MQRQTLALALTALFGLFMMGCHADENDVAGQAGELSDPVRRENAVANLTRLYTGALAEANGDRSAAGPRAVADASVERLTATYVEHPEDLSNGVRVLDLLVEMRDVRALPALVRALDWRAEVSEEHAIRAARVLQHLELGEAQKGEVVTAVARALGRVSQARGVDNRMRIDFLRALGNLGDRRATPALVEVMTRQSESQDFLINRLAAEQLGKLADPEAVPALVRSLYLFSPTNPAMRMNDVAGQALVRIGRPALEPLLATLRGENAEANQVATQYIAAVRQRSAEAAAQMSTQSVVSNDAAFSLGQLGFREAIAPLVAETQVGGTGELAPADAARVMGATIALVSVNREDADTATIRAALLAAYGRVPLANQMQLLVAMQHFMDPGLLSFFLEKAARPRSAEDEIPDQRILAMRAYAFLAAGAAETAPARALITAEPEGITEDAWGDFAPLLTVADECAQDGACWQRKLADGNPLIVRKAATMVARFGRGQAPAVAALVAQIGHANEEVRGEVLYALDYAASSGSPEAIARIDQLAEQEQGRAIWSHVESLARAIQARLHARSPH